MAYYLPIVSRAITIYRDTIVTRSGTLVKLPRWANQNVTGPGIVGPNEQVTVGGKTTDLPEGATFSNLVLDGPVAPLPLGTTAIVTAKYADGTAIPSAFMATFAWGDSKTSSAAAANGVIGAGHAYVTPGVYEVTATLDDGAGQKTTAKFQYGVVYDPSAGFVTGGGWINSPAGACVAAPELSGRATFGFAAKYVKGQTAPGGDTEFVFQAAGFTFESTSYRWLVVSGANAKFNGAGSVNGEPGYTFMLTATDGAILGSGKPDGFRIKISDASGVVYDNQMGQPDDGYAATQLVSPHGGGSIVVHAVKK